MNITNNQMKAIGIFLFTSIMFIHNSMTAQHIKPDSIFWNDGKVSLLSQLGPVWIIVKQGSDKKEVRIVEIEKEKGVLVYEKEKCLHDVAIHNIKVIQPGKYPISYMYFHPNNTPYIKREWFRLDPSISYSDFKSIDGIVKYCIEQPLQKTETKLLRSLCDTLIEENGNRKLVKIIEVDSKFITFKTSWGINSPIYVRCTNNASIKHYKNCISINFIKP